MTSTVVGSVTNFRFTTERVGQVDGDTGNAYDVETPEYTVRGLCRTTKRLKAWFHFTRGTCAAAHQGGENTPVKLYRVDARSALPRALRESAVASLIILWHGRHLS